MIKKLLIICALCLPLFSCGSNNSTPYMSGGVLVNYDDYIPNDVVGLWSVPVRLSAAQKEAILLAACSQAKWTVINKSDSAIEIVFQNKGITIYSEILYTGEKYTIRWLEWGQTKVGFPGTYKYYNRLAAKLNKVIQKKIHSVI